MVSTALPAGRRTDPMKPTYLWLLTRQNEGSEELLTAVSPGGKRTLPVFSFLEEAELFLTLGIVDGGEWQVSQIRSSDLAAVLLGPYRYVDRVALDPLPEGLGAEPLNLLASMSLAEFAELMLRRASSRTR